MPESKEDYLKRIEAGLKHLDKHLDKPVKDDYDWDVTGPMIKDLNWEITSKWKQSWWDRNPGTGDLIAVSSVIAVLGIIVAACQHTPAPGGAGAPRGNPPPYPGR